MKKFLIYALSLCAIVSCLQEERSPEEILVPTLAQVESSESSLMMTSKVPKGSEKLVDECGFYYSTDESMAHAVKVEASMDANNFAAELPERNYGTTYYICSYVTNGHGSEIRSEVSSYSLKALDKYIQFEPIELLSYDKTETSAEVTFDVEIWSGVKVSEIGVCFGVTTSPATEGRHVKGEITEEGPVSVSLDKYMTDKEYYLRAYVRDGDYTAYGEVTPLTIKLFPPTLSSVIVSSVKSSSATFSSAVTDDGGDKITEVGFYYSTDESVDPETSFKVNQVYTSESFSLEATNLQANTNYYVKSFAVNSVGVAYSEVASFMTAPGAPQMATLEATDVTESSAVLSGNVISDNGAAITECGFVWLKGSDAPTTSSNKVKVEGTTGDFTATLNDLEPNQKYSFRAYAVNSVGTSYGDVMYFTTVAGRPTLSVTKVTDITETSATFTSKVTSDGGSTPTEVGFYYSKEESLNVETAQKVSEVFSSDNFTLSVSDLEVGTTYYVKAFALNSTGEAYNNIVNFKTVSTAPSVQTTDASDISSSGVLLSGEVLDDNGEPISERGFVWVKGQNTPTTSSNKVNVDGTTGDYSATVSNLEPNQIYSYRAYATNSKGTAYGEIKSFVTLVAPPEVKFVSASDITSSSAVVSIKVTSRGGETVSGIGFLYGTTSSLDPYTASRVTSAYNTDSFSFTLDNLSRATEYYVRPFATNSAGTSYGETVQFVTLPDLPAVTTLEVTDIADNSAVCGGVITDDGGSVIQSKGVVWGKNPNPTIGFSPKTDEGSGMSSFTSCLTDLTSGSTYYVRAYAVNAAGPSYGEELIFTTTGEYPYVVLEAANCFIASKPGAYSFKLVKGNSQKSVGSVSSATVLWESFGTDEVPVVGSLVSSVSVQGDAIVFDVADPYREGNAVIAAKNTSGTILWSWHIWLTDQPQEQEYYNNAGTMMDRNLGATSATPGDVGALGLLYQWGRKDPFLGSSSISSNTFAKSTITWLSAVSSNTSGTIEYAIAHPTTFITNNSSNYDWYYTGSVRTDHTRWQSDKTIYDPCPAGWRVPDGGVWSKALGSDSYYTGTYDSDNKGMNFSDEFGSASTIWYPASGCRVGNDGALDYVGDSGIYWSVTPFDLYACYLGFGYDGSVFLPYYNYRAYGHSVRCLNE